MLLIFFQEILWTVLNWTRGAEKQNENALQPTPVQRDNFAELSFADEKPFIDKCFLSGE